MGLNKALLVVLAMVGMICSTALGFMPGDPPFPIRVACSKDWISESATQPVSVRIHSKKLNHDGTRYLSINMKSLDTDTNIMHAEGTLEKGGRYLAAEAIDRGQTIGMIYMRIKWSPLLQDYQLIMTFKGNHEPKGQSLTFKRMQ